MAADRIKGITIEIGGDTTKLASALKDVNGHLKDNAAQLRDLDKLLKLDPGNTTLLQQKFKVLGDSIEQAKSKLQTLKEAEKQLADSGQVGTKEWDSLQREIADTEGELKKLTDQYEEFGSVSKQQTELAAQRMQEFGGKVTDVGNKIKGAGQTISGAGKSMMPVTAGIVAMGTAAIKTGMDFDASMSQVAAVSGAVGEDFDDLRAKAIEMGSKTKFSASESADAMNYMAMAGWKTKDMLSGIDGIMNLAAASNTDLATTSDIVTDALTAFGKSAKDSGELADMLASAGANANTNVAMMGETFKYIAPVAGALGFSMQDTAVAAGLMANAGIKASQSGTTLRTGISRLIDPTDQVAACMVNLGLATAQYANEVDKGKIEKAQTKVANKTIEVQKAQLKYNEALQKYGADSSKAQTAALNLQKAQNNLKDAESALTQAMQGKQKVIGVTNNLLTDGHGNINALKDVMVQLRSAMSGLTKEEQAQAVTTLFGTNAMSGWLAIINASDEDFNNLCTAIDNSAGSAEEMARIMNDNAKGDFTILMSNLQTLAISINDLLTPTLRGIVEHLQNFITWLNSLDEGTKKTIVTVALLVAAVGPVLMVIGGVVSAIGTLIVAGGNLIKFGSKIGGVFAGLGGSAGKAASSLGGLGSAAGSAAAPAKSAGKAIGTLSQNALGFVALGAGILMASAGLTMMAKAAIELGQAGAPAAIAMAAMVAVLALLAVGAAALGPALTAGAVGLVAFGAAITLVGLGVLAASAGLSMLAGHLPTIAQYGGAAATAIGQLALAIAAFGLAAVVAAAGALALAAGFLAFSGGAVSATVAGVAFTAALLALTVAVLALTVAVVSFSAALVVLAAAIVAVGAAVLISTTMIVNAFKVAGDAAKNTLEGIRNGFTNTFNAVRIFMRGIVSWLKGLFKFEWSLPKIKLPHFSISGSFSLNPPSIPSFSVDWYRKAMDGGMILNSPTIFGMSGGRLLGGGEAGPEAVVGVDSLRSMIQAAVAGAGGGGDIIIPVYIGQERIDETVVTASQRANYRSGGR